jgi:hypothetical protein
VCRVLDAKDRFADALSGGWTAGKSASEIAVTRPKKSQFNFSEKNIRLKVFSPADLIPIPLYHVILGVVVAIMWDTSFNGFPFMAVFLQFRGMAVLSGLSSAPILF